MRKSKTKKSQSSIITNVLMIIIAIAAVVIVSAWIFNFLNEKKQIDNINIALSIDSVGTFYDTSSTAELGNLNPSSGEVGINYVKISMSSNGSELSSLKLVFNIRGNSVVCTTALVPKQLESRAYKYTAEKAEAVEIVPVVLISGKEKLMPVAAKSDINNVNKNLNVLDSSVIELTSCSSGDLPTSPGKV